MEESPITIASHLLCLPGTKEIYQGIKLLQCGYHDTKLFYSIQEFNVKAGPCIEYYEKDFIHFILPLDHHEQFYVPGVESNYQ